MKRAIILFVVFGLTTACGQKSAKVAPPAEDAPIVEKEPAPEVADTEEAKGDLREAIIALRRVHFALDSTELNEESREALTGAAQKLGDKAKVHLYVEGHADETGETEYNLGLGERRAMAVRDYLNRMGVSKEQLHIVSFGEEKPLKPGSSAAAMALNRRVDFKLMRGDVELEVREGTPVNN